ncbi:hypothetical protein K2X05_12040 [bacterium]|nr:hypothetical protein [bacterium]
MKKWIYFISTLMFFLPAIAIDLGGQGIYDLGNPSAEVSEVTRAPEPVLAPQPEPQLTTASAPAKVPTATATPPSTPQKNYSISRNGYFGSQRALLYSLRSCEPIKFMSGTKPSKPAREKNCSPIEVDKAFGELLMSDLPICIAEGVKASGVTKKIKRTNIYNDGTFADRDTSSGSISLHANARAIDINRIDVQFEDNTWLNTPMTINSKKNAFYVNFNKCWVNRTIARMKKESTKSCHYFKGVIDCKDKYHTNHVHLSMPYCPRRRGFAGY